MREENGMGHAGLSGFMNVSIVMLVIGFTVLLLMVQFELGPMCKLSGGRKWLLTLILGSGMVAFSIKLIVIATLLNFPKQTIGAHLRAPQGRPPQATVAPRYAVYDRPDSGSKLYVWQALPEVAPAPAWNPTTPEKVALGERLFHDTALSADRTVSCSSCHEVRQGAGMDGRRTSLGIGGQLGARNAPTVWNAAFQSVLFWDGRAASLEEQAKGPPLNPKEMGMPSLEALVQRVREDATYREAFDKAFGAGQPITIAQIVAAIAAYERTLITPDAPYDRFVRGDVSALNAAQLRGMELFQSVGCIQCHSGPNFSGASVFDKAPNTQRLFPVFDSPEYVARYNLTGDVGTNAVGSKQGVWRIPSLRNVALTAPYFHNGKVDSLAEAVRIMATVQRGKRIGGSSERTVIWSQQDRTISRVETAALSDRKVSDIVAFLESLSSDMLLARVARP
jgi:cytochrome c peroxidase